LIAVDEPNNTIYAVNHDDNTVSVINGAVCNGTNISGCGQTWATVTVGSGPQALGVNPVNHTIYVANFDDDTVSVIDGNTCNGTNTSGCGQTPPTVFVGAGPRSVGIDSGTNTIFVGNRDDGTVSIIDGSTCNGTNSSGCGQTPAALFVMAFPGSAGTDDYINGRTIVVDPATHKAYLPTIGDSDAVVISGSPCTGADPSGCTAEIVPLRMGGFSVFATLDDSSGTVYVANDTDGTVSLFAK
jgi:YVTN family beta-propeller protein